MFGSPVVLILRPVPDRFQIIGSAFVFQVSGPEAVHPQHECTRKGDTNFTNLNDYDLELQYWEHLEVDMPESIVLV